MADEIQELLERNKSWAKKIEQEDPGFFARLTKQQISNIEWDTASTIYNADVETIVVEDGDKVIVSFIRENGEGKFTTEYIIENGKVKTTAYFTNYIYDNNKFAFTQTLDLPDNLIYLNNDVIDFLLKIEWWNWSDKKIIKNEDFFSLNLNETNDFELNRIIK